MASTAYRPAWVEVDLDAIAHNARLLAHLSTPSALCAVVKADGYGHGAIAAARAALQGGARMLAVALVEEGVALREAGIEAPVLILSEPTGGGIAEALARGLTPTLYSPAGIAGAGAAARAESFSTGLPARVQLKLDTGMHRVGASPDDAVVLARAIGSHPELVLEGVWTHLAVADEPSDPFNEVQLERFMAASGRLLDAGIGIGVRHMANTAGAIALPSTRLDLVRCGIGLYGYVPSPAVASVLDERLGGGEGLRPALSLKARVHMVRDLDAGERTSYGRTYELARAGQVAVLPLGYHDGVARRLAPAGAEVLLGGVRRPFAGTVTMDQLIVDCTSGPVVAPGDEAVLIGRQGGEEITAEEWARHLGTISYEILCGIGPRVPRITSGLASPHQR